MKKPIKNHVSLFLFGYMMAWSFLRSLTMTELSWRTYRHTKWVVSFFYFFIYKRQKSTHKTWSHV